MYLGSRIEVSWLKRPDMAGTGFIHFALIVWLILSCGGTAYSGDYNPAFERLSISNGLSQNTVTCIIQDSKGFMWFGTQYGLNRYDGYKFEKFKTDPWNTNSISDNYINAIFEDAKGVLWVGTRSGGVNRYDPDKDQWTRFRHDARDSDSISSNQIFVIHADRKGFLWAATPRGGLDRLTPESGVWKLYTFSPADSENKANSIVMSLWEDDSGIFWLGTNRGLVRFNPDTEETVFYMHDSRNPNSLSHNYVTSLVMDATGILWIGTYGGGINRFDPAAGQWTHFRGKPEAGHLSSDRVLFLYKRSSGDELWVGTDGEGLCHFDLREQRWHCYRFKPEVPDSISENIINCILEDRSGLFWIGTANRGLNKFDPQKERWGHFRHDPNNSNSLNHNTVAAIYEDRAGLLWVGTLGGGLNRLDRKSGRWTAYSRQRSDPNGPGHELVTSIVEDGQGALWVGTWGGGVSRLDRKSGQWFRYRRNPKITDGLQDNRIEDLFIDSQDSLWIGTHGGGLHRFDHRLNRWTVFRHQPDNLNSLSHDNVMTIFEDKSGILWIGTYGGGLNAFDRENGLWRSYRHNPQNPNSLSSNFVISIYEDSFSMLWVGTSSGLNQFDRVDRKWRRYSMKEGLVNDLVYGILEDDSENLWLSTNRGLSRYNLRSNFFKNYTEADGLQSDEFNQGAFFKSEQGEMFFGGINGFNCFFPDRIKKNTHVPPVLITALNSFDRPIKLAEAINESGAITLSYKDDYLVVEFAALDYRNPLKNQYAYKLEGLNKGWVFIGNRRYATFAHLAPGHYVFRVKGSNNDRVWNHDGSSLIIEIDPPVWGRWWFRVLLGLLALTAAIGLFQWRFHRIEVQKRRLEIEVAERTKELKAKNDELTEAYRQLGQVARKDPLTNLSNRRDMMEKIENEKARFERSGKPFALILGDIDNFKSVNDRFGHDAGDFVLITMSQTFRSMLRSQDSVGRWGGEEFIFLLPNTEGTGGWKVAEKIRNAIIKRSCNYRGQKISVTITLGVSIYNRPQAIKDCIKMADEALYKGKIKGKNQVVVA